MYSVWQSLFVTILAINIQKRPQKLRKLRNLNDDKFIQSTEQKVHMIVIFAMSYFNKNLLSNVIFVKQF